MPPAAPVNIVLGTHTVGDQQAPGAAGIVHFANDNNVNELLNTFYSRGYRQLDTASLYPGSELCLGRAGAPSRFTIHTKVHSGQPGDHEVAKLKKSVERSLAELKTDSVETMFLHVPDRQTPFEEVAKAMDDLAKQGAFRRFGLSNYSPDEVKRFLDICEERGYVKPSVYQGHYNALGRGGEESLFPLLREHSMSFFAYSAAAAGIFAQENPDSSRWKNDNQIGQLYSMMYNQPAVQKSIAKIRQDVAKHNISGHAAALRWTAYHSILDGRYGDAIIFAVSKLSQLHSSLDALEEGPLPEKLAEEISAVYSAADGTGLPFHL